MGKEIIVRRISPEELDSLIALYAHLHRKDSPAPRRPTVDAIWPKIVTSPFFHCIVGEWENRIVSSCSLATIPNLTRGARPYGIIENVVTQADFRKRGFGTAVLRYALR